MSNELREASEAGLTSLVSGIAEDAQTLFRQQVALIRTEIHEDFRKAKAAALLLVVGALAAPPAIILLCFGTVYLMYCAVPGVPLWAWFLIGGGAVGIASGVFIYSAVQKFKSSHPLLGQSVAALKENFEWRTNPSESTSKCAKPALP
jgi:hypothetical protein